MNRVLQGRRQLLMQVRRLGSYRGYDIYSSNSFIVDKKVFYSF